jgi:hypothetical protein
MYRSKKNPYCASAGFVARSLRVEPGLLLDLSESSQNKSNRGENVRCSISPSRVREKTSGAWSSKKPNDPPNKSAGLLLDLSESSRDCCSISPSRAITSRIGEKTFVARSLRVELGTKCPARGLARNRTIRRTSRRDCCSISPSRAGIVARSLRVEPKSNLGENAPRAWCWGRDLVKRDLVAKKVPSVRSLKETAELTDLL